jgi:hypothetical protein
MRWLNQILALSLEMVKSFISYACCKNTRETWQNVGIPFSPENVPPIPLSEILKGC